MSHRSPVRLALFGGEQAIRSAPPATALWSDARHASGIRAFRVVTAVLLALYFAELGAILPGLIGADGLHDGRGVQAWLELDAARVQAVCGIGMALACGIALGAVPRVCAGLLLLLTVTLQRAAAATSTLDDVAVAIALFWLCLLPLEHARRQAWVEGRTASLCALHLMFVQLDVGLWQAFAPSWPAFGSMLGLLFIALAVALLAPSSFVRGAATAGVVALHLALAARGTTGLAFAHLVLASSSCLMIGAAPAGQEAAHPARQPWSAASVLGAVVLALTLLWRAALALHAPEVMAASQRLLADVGVVPLAAPRYPVSSPAVHVRGDDGAVRELAVVDTARARRLIAQLFGSGPATAALREHVIRALVTRACAHGAASGTLIVSDGAPERPLAWFECARGSDATRVVVLNERKQGERI